jgi:hypothetical protein
MVEVLGMSPFCIDFRPMLIHIFTDMTSITTTMKNPFPCLHHHSTTPLFRYSIGTNHTFANRLVSSEPHVSERFVKHTESRTYLKLSSSVPEDLRTTVHTCKQDRSMIWAYLLSSLHLAQISGTSCSAL